ncbi:MAG: hypothetical protein J0M07_23365, partial [Anaerolineae bacterium]|nr:hypothetical protein [Anaerolineae bacterium]
RQRLRISEDIYAWKVILVATVPFVLFVTLLIFISYPNNPLYALVGGVVSGATLLWLYVENIARPLSTIHHGSVETVEGRINQQIKGQRTNLPGYWIEIDSLRFKMNQKRFLLLKNHDPYRFYYTRKRVWSVISLREDNPFLNSSSQTDAALNIAGRPEQIRVKGALKSNE